MRPASDCNTMTELRAEIDALDDQLVGLLARRATYIDRAIDLKQIENLPARTSDRVAEVLTHVRDKATARGLDGDLVTRIWHELIEWSIAREEVVLGPDEK